MSTKLPLYTIEWKHIVVTGTLTMDKNKLGSKFATQGDYINSLQSIHWLDNLCHDNADFIDICLHIPIVEFN